MSETTKILPLPVKKNKFGRRIADISITEYYRQIEEEVLESFKEAVCSELYEKINSDKKICNADREAEELVDLITCCVTRLEIIGYDEEKRQKLYEFVNEKNRKRGYFDEV